MSPIKFFCGKRTERKGVKGLPPLLAPSAGFHINRERQWKKKRLKEAIDFRNSAYAVFFCRLLLRESVLFGALGVVLEEQAEGGEAKQKGLDKPQAASGRAVDTFVTAGT